MLAKPRRVHERMLAAGVAVVVSFAVAVDLAAKPSTRPRVWVNHVGVGRTAGNEMDGLGQSPNEEPLDEADSA
jgi:hypothetical protein